MGTPVDTVLFSTEQHPTLREAAGHLSWLLERGYSPGAALKLVGDRFTLHARQRKALMRGVCAPQIALQRQAQRSAVAGADVMVDGFNVIVTVETAMVGGLLVRGLDGLLRDLAGMHGRYRDVDQTRAAIALLAGALQGASRVRWVLDRPVSNSGRLAGMLREAGFDDVTLTDLADRTLAESGAMVATADGPLLDRAAGGVDIVSPVVAALPQAWVVSLSDTSAH
jgi:hypothetical protein